MCEGSVLLETAKFDAQNYRSLLFTGPVRQFVGWTPKDARAVFAEVDHHLQQGSFVAGFVSYECGEALQGIPPRPQEAKAAVPLIAMGVFTAPTIFDHRTGQVQGGAPTISEHSRQAAAVVQAGLQITAAAYEQQIHRIQDYLAAGHSYQVNFTDSVQGMFTGSHLDLYETLLARQPVSYAAFVNLVGQQVLSFSPELFYRVQDGSIRVRPMKGTWPRGRNTAEDEYAARSLKIDEKNRAEHITIVDLLRNDLGKVCELGSVQVNALMRVERYRSLHQMTSDISGRLLPHLKPAEVFQNIFPSGSITGAPKRRTMEIIQETERAARGVYTGAIGYFAPQNEACFNVAIRTLLVQGTTFTLGVGGGVTLDSTPSGEYAECKLKAAFLTQSGPEFHLFETMRAVSGSAPRLESHLQRMRDSAIASGAVPQCPNAGAAARL